MSMTGLQLQSWLALGYSTHVLLCGVTRSLWWHHSYHSDLQPEESRGSTRTLNKKARHCTCHAIPYTFPYSYKLQNQLGCYRIYTSPCDGTVVTGGTHQSVIMFRYTMRYSGMEWRTHQYTDTKFACTKVTLFNLVGCWVECWIIGIQH